MIFISILSLHLFTYGLFIKAVSSSDYIVMNNELERIWNDMIMV